MMGAIAQLAGRITEYEDFGDRSAPPLMVVSGIGSHMFGWPTEFCEELAFRGLRVIRFDNRDTGAATRTVVAPPYDLHDMACDMVALMDFLGVERAHVAGISFGGMVVQRLAIDWPNRVATLISIMSSTGHPDVGESDPRAVDAIMRPTDGSLSNVVSNVLEFARISGGPMIDEDVLREFTRVSYDRSYDPEAKALHLAASQADGDRTAELAKVTTPTLVIHGAADLLIGVSGGRATAASIPGAELLEIQDMGHSIVVPALWERLATAISGKILDTYETARSL